MARMKILIPFFHFFEIEVRFKNGFKNYYV